MSEVRYSINGKYFKDFGVYISESDGLFDQLKRKTVNTYDWAEYHGSSPDLSNPKFEAREITLKGYVVGADWLTMKANFDTIVGEFQKAGTQRLLIEPLGLKALPFEVYCDDATPLNKTFRQGKMVGTFTLKLIEPNPIKKVLYFTGTSLNLSYTSPNETEIFYGNGLKETAKGNVSISGKTLANRVVSEYAFEGRNLLLNSKVFYLNANDTGLGTSILRTDESDPYYRAIPDEGNAVSLFGLSAMLENAKEYVIGLWVRHNHSASENISVYHINGNPNGEKSNTVPPNEWTFIKTDVIKGMGQSSPFIMYGTSPNVVLDYKKAILVQGNKLGSDWTAAPEEQKYIIIAGSIEEITDLTTNADKILWERL